MAHIHIIKIFDLLPIAVKTPLDEVIKKSNNEIINKIRKEAYSWMFDIYTAKESYGYINNLPINEGSYVFTECDESNRINALIDYYIESKSIAEARILLNQIKEYIEVCDNSNLQINLDPT